MDRGRDKRQTSVIVKETITSCDARRRNKALRKMEPHQAGGPFTKAGVGVVREKTAECRRWDSSATLVKINT